MKMKNENETCFVYTLSRGGGDLAQCRAPRGRWRKKVWETLVYTNCQLFSFYMFFFGKCFKKCCFCSNQFYTWQSLMIYFLGMTSFLMWKKLWVKLFIFFYFNFYLTLIWNLLLDFNKNQLILPVWEHQFMDLWCHFGAPKRFSVKQICCCWVKIIKIVLRGTYK